MKRLPRGYIELAQADTQACSRKLQLALIRRLKPAATNKKLTRRQFTQAEACDYNRGDNRGALTRRHVAAGFSLRKKILISLVVFCLVFFGGLNIQEARATTTGAVYPTLGASVAEAPWSDEAWVTPTNIYLDDGVTASVTAATFDSPDQTGVLKATGFNFSAIPDNAVIQGVIVRVNAWNLAGLLGSMDLLQLLNTSKAKVGTNQCAAAVPLTTTDTTIITKGSSTDLWGNALTPAWVKSANFGVAIGILATTINADVFVDYVTIEIYYSVPPGPPSLLEPAHNAAAVDIYTVFRTSASDADGDNLRYKIEIDNESSFSSPVSFTFDQTPGSGDQFGWSGQDAAGGTAYVPLTVAKTTETLISPLAFGTTYYWRAKVIDYLGSNTYSQSTATNTFVTRGLRFYASSSTTANWPDDGKPEIAIGEDHEGNGHLQLVSIGSGKVMALYNDLQNGIYNLRYKIFDGSIWGSEQTVVTDALDTKSATEGNEYHYFSAVSDSANAIHLVYIDTAYDVKYTSYTAGATPVWSTPGLIQAGAFTHPSLSYDSENNAIYAFWIDVNSVKYSSRTAASAWSAPKTLADALDSPSYLGSSSSSPLRIGIIWREKIEAPYSITYSTLTLVPAPQNPQIDSVFLSSITLKWNAMSSNKGYIVQASTKSDFTGTIHSSKTADGNAAALTVFEPALDPNTRYYLRAGSLWNCGATTYATPIVSTATLAAPPGAPAVFSEVYYTSMTVTWPANGNPTYTEYYLWVSTAADFTGTIYYSAYGAQWFTGAFAEFTGFCANRTYYFRAKARNLYNIETAVTDIGNKTAATSSPIDCGFRFYLGGVVKGACQDISSCPAELKLRIRKGDENYGIILVDPGDTNASKLKIQTPSGAQSIRKYP